MAELAEGCLVRHRQFGIGEVQEARAQELVVAFRKDRERTISSDEVVPLSPDGFWHLAYTDPTAVVQQLGQRPTRVVALLLRDMPNNQAQTAEIRSHLEEFVSEEWRSWWQQTQRLLRQDPAVDTSRSREGIYALARKPRSYIKELYDGFRDLSFLKIQAKSATPVVNPDKLAMARSILVAVANGELLAVDEREQVQDFIVRAVSHDTVPVAERVDLLLRLVDQAWISAVEAETACRELCRVPVKLYELGRFAQNRIVDFILKCVGAEEGRDSLLTAFATSPALLQQVYREYTSRGQATQLARGIGIGLAESLVGLGMEKEEVRRWYAAFTQRLQALGTALHTLLFDDRVQLDWDRIAFCLDQLVVRLSQLDLEETVTEELLDQLAGFWRRCLVFAPLSKKVTFLDVTLTTGVRIGVIKPLLEVVFADPHSEFADSLVDRMRQSLQLCLEPYLECIVREHWGWNSDADALAYLVTCFNSNASALTWLAQCTVDSAQSRRDALPLYLPVLDQLVLCDQQVPWREQVDGLRQRAFYDLCHTIKGEEYPDLSPFAFDHMCLAGLQEFVIELEGSLAASVHEAQSEVARAQEEARQARFELQQSQSDLAELRQGYRQPDRAIRFEERVRILKGIATTTAEIERFAAYQVTSQKELVGVLRRLNSWLGSLGATPFGEIGAPVVFDPSCHEFVGLSDRSVEAVTIIERGYMIQDLDGREQLLKPARVALAREV